MRMYLRNSSSIPKFLTAFLSLILLVACEQSSSDLQDQEVSAIQKRLNRKAAPADFLNLKYAYPGKYPDPEFIKEQHQKAKEWKAVKALSRSNNNGISEPWNSEGPGNFGGRINVIEPHPTNADIVLIGYSNGGIFKTTDGGVTWNPVFDDAPFLSISEITYDASNPNIVYAGTGDHNINIFPFAGDGIYKSTDGGDTWSQLGLAETGIISRIIVHPTNGDIIYAATMGVPFEAGPDRGLYKTTDGGATWNKILYPGPNTGAIDLVMDPFNPATIYVAAWDRIRNTQQSIVWGPNAKIYKSSTSGSSWSHLSAGLPSGNQSRIGLAISEQTPNRVYAVYIGSDLQLEGIYQSNNGGSTWGPLAQSGLDPNMMSGFGWYFAQLRVNPEDDDEMLIAGVRLWESDNSGSTFNQATSFNVHADVHDMQYSVDQTLWLATDGGLYKKSSAPGSDWQDVENIRATQFYRVAVNPHVSGQYFGGAQDNGTSYGNSDAPDNWTFVFGGDGFSIAFHPTDDQVFYVETQNGNILKTLNGAVNFISATAGIDNSDTKPWDMFYTLSPHNPNKIYTGTQKIYSATNVGSPFLMPISEDLTKAAQSTNSVSFHHITHIDESTLQENLLYVGTSDGWVWKKEGSADWENITNTLPNRFVTRTIASREVADRVFTTHSGYRDNDNTPYLHVSHDKGQTWTSLQGDLPMVGINDVEFMPGTEDSVLMIGTEVGAFISLDFGAHWNPLGTGLPSVPIFDMALDLDNNKLLIGTYARSMYTYPLDSIDLNAEFQFAGIVKDRNGNPVNNVVLTSGAENVTTSTNGLYALPVDQNENCTVTAFRDGHKRDGVDILDLVLLQRHMLFFDTLSVLGQLAGDVNGDDKLSPLDLIFIQRNILYIDSTFADGVWDFLPEDEVILDSVNIFENAPSEILSCSDTPSSQNFWTVKNGDVSGNAPLTFTTNDGQIISELDATKSSGMRYEIEHVETHRYALKISTSEPISGLQFFLNIENVNLENIETSDENIQTHNGAQYLSILWTSASSENQDLPKTMLFFDFLGEATELGALKVAMNQSFAVRRSQGIWEKYTLDLSTPVSNFSPNQNELSFEVYPNPAADIINIRSQTLHEFKSISIVNTTGQVVLSAELYGSDESPSMNVSGLASGLYYVVMRKESGEGVSRKILIQ